MNMKKFWLIKFITITLSLCGCGSMDKFGRMGGPHTKFKKELENASPDFQQGWHDGCETGRHGGGNTFYKAFTKSNKVDGYKIAESHDYSVAWSSGWWYCYRDDYIDQKVAPFEYFFGGAV